jgi:hypothetical protein
MRVAFVGPVGKRFISLCRGLVWEGGTSGYLLEISLFADVVLAWFESVE